MKDTRLIKLMKCFTKKELKSFGNFVNSPFLKPARKHTSDLYKYLIQFKPGFDSTKMNKIEAFNYIFEGKKYDEKKIQNLLTDLTNSVEDFLSLSTLMKDELEFKLNLSKGYMKKNLTYESNRINILIEKNLRTSFSPFTDYFSKLKRLNNLRFVHFNTVRNLAEAVKSLEDIFEASILQFIFEYMNFIDNTENPYNQLQTNENQRKLIQKIRQTVNPEALIDLLKSNGEQSDYLKLHCIRFKTILDRDNFEDYFEMKKLFFRILVLSEKDKDYLNREERNLFFVYMINYCITQLSNDDKKSKIEILDLYKKMLETDSYSSEEGEYLNVAVYRNIILLCSSQDEKFMIELLEKYITRLHPDYREDMKHAGYARLEFFRKRYENSLEHLSKIKNYSIPMFKTDIKHLQLKSYYELSYFEQAYSLINTYKSYLASTVDLDDIFKTAYRNFVDLCCELIKIKSGKGIENIRAIKRRIENEAHPGFKPWLLEKVNELEQA